MRWLSLALVIGVTTLSACHDGDRAFAGLDAGRPGDCDCPPGTICLCRDAGGPVPDARADAWRPPRPPPPGCQQGLPCTPDRGCASGECLAEFVTTVGSAMDPISDLPSGATTIPSVSWLGGYCTTNPGARVREPGACDFAAPEDVDDGCGPCGQCVNAGTDALGMVATLCLAACTPSAMANPCRSSYTCSLAVHGCMPGCGSDNECRVYREDTNRNGVFDEGVDRLVYDSESVAQCNVTTGRCDHAAAPGATAGIACERDSECEENGECLAEISSGWPGGYCTKRGCEVAGRECTGAGDVCAPLPGEEPWLPPSTVRQCFQGCAVGQEPMADRLGHGGHGLGCRPEYACAPNWSALAGDPFDGVCVPGVYDDVVANNIGAPCAPTTATDNPDLQCYSPFGLGRCLTTADWGGAPSLAPLPTGICTVLECGAPGLTPSMPCGPDNQCVGIGGMLSACLHNCVTAADCATGYACAMVSAGPGDPRACVPSCGADYDCAADRHCLIPPGEMVGRCVLR